LSQVAAARVPPPIWVLALAVSGANVGISLLAPAIPDLRRDLMATADQAQLVLSAFLIMLGFAQLGAGTLSDRIGRRPILLTGALLFSITGIGALLSTSIEMLIFMRVFQGIGAAGCMAMARVIISDSYERAEAGKQMSTITMFQAVVPLIGFAFGGMLVDLVGWRGSVSLMLATALTVLVSAWFLVRESRLEKGPALPLIRIFGVYGRLIVTGKFITNAGASALVTAAFFAMGGFMPYHFQRMGASAMEFGLFFSATAIGYMTGNNLNRTLALRLGTDRAAVGGSFVSLAAMTWLVAVAYLELDPKILISIGLFGYGVGNGLVVANTLVGAIRAAGPHSGVATGLCGAIQMLGSAAIGSLIISLGGDQNFPLAISLCWVMMVVSLCCAWLAREGPEPA